MKTQTHFPNKSFRKITRIGIHTGYKTKLSTEQVDIFPILILAWAPARLLASINRSAISQKKILTVNLTFQLKFFWSQSNKIKVPHMSYDI